MTRWEVAARADSAFLDAMQAAGFKQGHAVGEALDFLDIVGRNEHRPVPEFRRLEDAAHKVIARGAVVISGGETSPAIRALL